MTFFQTYFLYNWILHWSYIYIHTYVYLWISWLDVGRFHRLVRYWTKYVKWIHNSETPCPQVPSPKFPHQFLLMRYLWSVRICILCIWIYIYIHTLTDHEYLINRNWCVNFGAGVDRGLLNYVFILYTLFNNKPYNATYLRQVTVSAISVFQVGFRERIVDVTQYTRGCVS